MNKFLSNFRLFRLYEVHRLFKVSKVHSSSHIFKACLIWIYLSLSFSILQLDSSILWVFKCLLNFYLKNCYNALHLTSLIASFCSLIKTNWIFRFENIFFMSYALDWFYIGILFRIFVLGSILLIHEVKGYIGFYAMSIRPFVWPQNLSLLLKLETWNIPLSYKFICGVNWYTS